MNVTTLWKAIRANKEDRVAKLEWAPNGGLGRAVIGKVKFASDKILEIYSQQLPEHAAYVRPRPPRSSHAGKYISLPIGELIVIMLPQDTRIFNGPDGYQYCWRPSNNSTNDILVGLSRELCACLVFS